MLGQRKAREIGERVLALSTADQTEAVIIVEDNALTRFANSTIHQNVAEYQTKVQVRTVIGKRVGRASTYDLSDAALENAVEAAVTATQLQPEDPDFVSLPEPAPIQEIAAFDQETATFSPEARARAVGDICHQARENDLLAAGAFSSGIYELAVMNSLGVFAYYQATLADLNTVIMSDDSSGYAAATSWKVGEIDAEAVGLEAVDKALRSRNPREIEPGRYPVVLEEYAVEDFVEMLGLMGFGAQSMQEGWGFTAGRLGQRLLSEKISIRDDGLDPTGWPLPFDFEGVPRQRVDLIERGIAKAVVYDTYRAGKDNTRSTGHHLPRAVGFRPITSYGVSIGALPSNVFVATGEATLEEMIASTERGLYVTRFHYTRPVVRKQAVVTGMTRDGTFLIEKGEIAYPLKNLRFTQSYLEALSGVEMVGRTAKLMRGMPGNNRVPALKLSGFQFTGVTEF